MKRSSKKPNGRNPRLSRGRILGAALKEFAAKGFAGARVDAIAHQARINKRMLYHYFGDKEGLFREVLRRKLAERSAWLAAAPDNPIDSLPYWFSLASGDKDWVRLLEWEALQRGDLEVIDEPHRRDNVRQAIERVRRSQSTGILSSEFDPGQLLLSMMALTAYPLAFPQMTRLITGMSASDPGFQEKRKRFLRSFAAALQPRSTPDRHAMAAVVQSQDTAAG